MRIVQVAHALTPLDAASRQLLRMDGMLRGLGFETAMYARRGGEAFEGRVARMDAFAAEPDDIVIYHMTTGTSFNRWVWRYPQKIVLYYHNITPARYFFGNAWGSWLKCLWGRYDLKKIARNTLFAWGASEYSRRELAAVGIAHTGTLPIVIDSEAYRAHAVDEDTLRYRDGRVNLLVVGRGVPHKRQDEAIEAVAWYKAHISSAVRLVFIGNHKPGYEKKLRALVKAHGMEKDVLFLGAVSDAALCTWYRIADGLLCLSEHEGFCVPLVEAMVFGLPVFAKPAAAVPETLGDGGVLLEKTTPEGVAMAVSRTLSDGAALSRLAAGRERQLARLSYASVAARLGRDLEEIDRLWKELRR